MSQLNPEPGPAPHPSRCHTAPPAPSQPAGQATFPPMGFFSSPPPHLVTGPGSTWSEVSVSFTVHVSSPACRWCPHCSRHLLHPFQNSLSINCCQPTTIPPHIHRVCPKPPKIKCCNSSRELSFHHCTPFANDFPPSVLTGVPELSCKCNPVTCTKDSTQRQL